MKGALSGLDKAAPVQLARQAAGRLARRGHQDAHRGRLQAQPAQHPLPGRPDRPGTPGE